MHTLKRGPLNKKELRDFLVSACALGLLWAWFLCAGNIGPQVFGIETGYDAILRLVTPLPITIVMFLFGSRRLGILIPYRPQLLLGTIGCVASTCFFLFLQASASDNAFLFATFSFLASFFYAVLLHAWIRKNLTDDFFRLSLCVFCASIVMILLYLVLQFLPMSGTVWCAVVALALAAMLLNSMPTPCSQPQPSPAREAGSRKWPLLASLVLANFANGILLASWVPSNAVNWTYAVIPLGLIACALALLLKEKLTPYSGFALLSAFACASIVIVLTLPSSTPLLSSLIFATFWLLFAFSLSTATWNGARSDMDALRMASKYMGCIVIATFSSRIVGTFVAMQDMAYLVIAAVLLAFSLALALVAGNTTSVLAETEHGSAFDSSLDTNELCGRIAQEKGLTERERDVFCLLAKGYSLKSIAERLFVSENTVKSHRRRIYLKLDINSRQELIDLVEAGRSSLD